jgi:hypothetical protein
MSPYPPPLCRPVKRESHREPVNSVHRLHSPSSGRPKNGRTPPANTLSLSRAARSDDDARFKTPGRWRQTTGGKYFPQGNSSGQDTTR